MQTLDCENREIMKLREDLSILLWVLLFFTCVGVNENHGRINELEVADSIARARVDSILMAHSQEIE